MKRPYRRSRTARRHDYFLMTTCRPAAKTPPGSAAPRLRRAAASAAGFTLLETLMTVGLVAVMLAVYSATLTSTVFLRRSQYNTLAANYIQEELDTLRTLPFSELINRTNGNFLGLAFQRGHWSIQDVSGDGQNKRLAMDAAAPAIGDDTGLAVLPGNYRTDFTLTAKVKVDSASPAGWGGGLVFRYRDAENFYRLRYAAGGNALDKVVRGTVTTVWSDSSTCTTTIPTGSCWAWQTLEVVASGTSLTLKRNGSTLTTLVDTTFGAGDLGIQSKGNALISADDVSVTEGAVTAWDFESETAGTYPIDWLRMSCFDLPGGSCSLTIENYLDETSLKKVTAVVSWLDGDSTRSSSGATVIGQ